jgi:hypothetical protein
VDAGFETFWFNAPIRRSIGKSVFSIFTVEQKCRFLTDQCDIFVIQKFFVFNCNWIQNVVFIEYKIFIFYSWQIIVLRFYVRSLLPTGVAGTPFSSASGQVPTFATLTSDICEADAQNAQRTHSIKKLPCRRRGKEEGTMEGIKSWKSNFPQIFRVRN